ncbi:MAG TPA: YfcE family phosphodiesterase [Candidatus Saccharimonadales bacterium]|jgi:hypothetical protein
MRIGIFSDTHNKLAGIDQAFAIFARDQVAVAIHCGDWTAPDTLAYVGDAAGRYDIAVKGVLGNNDRDVSGFVLAARGLDLLDISEGVLELEIGGRQIAAYHGHHAPTLRRLLADGPELLLLGHSHKPRFDKLAADGKVRIILNPGSTAFSIPRRKGWHGSVAVYDTEKHDAKFIYFEG